MDEAAHNPEPYREATHHPYDAPSWSARYKAPEARSSWFSRRVVPVMDSVGARTSVWSRKLLEPRQPSLVVFTPVAVATTLFMGLIIGFSVAQLSGDPEQALKSSIIAAVSLPIALLAAIFLSLGLPYRWFASSSTPVALLSSYAPYIVGSLSGVWAALWLWHILPFEYGSISTAWQWSIAGVGTGAWFVVGRFTNHLAGVVERRKDYEKGLERADGVPSPYHAYP